MSFQVEQTNDELAVKGVATDRTVSTTTVSAAVASPADERNQRIQQLRQRIATRATDPLAKQTAALSTSNGTTTPNTSNVTSAAETPSSLLGSKARKPSVASEAYLFSARNRQAAAPHSGNGSQTSGDVSLNGNIELHRPIPNTAFARAQRTRDQASTNVGKFALTHAEGKERADIEVASRTAVCGRSQSPCVNCTF